MTTRARTVVIVASDASGVDEGLVAALLGRRRAGPKAAILPGFGVGSRFASLCAGVKEYRAHGADNSTWDDIFDVVRSGGATLCVEGGAATAFFDWCADTRIAEVVGDDVQTVLVVPVTRAESAVTAAMRTIEAARCGAARRGVPITYVFLVLNARLGDPLVLAQDRGLVVGSNYARVRMGAAPLLVTELEASGRRLDAVDRFVGRKGVGLEVGALFGWEKFHAGHQMALYRNWLWDCEEAFGIMGLFR